MDSSRRNLILTFIGLGLVFVMLAAALGTITILRESCAIVAGIFLLGAIVACFKREPKPYDLRTLRQFHEKELVRNLDVEQAEEFDSVLCMNCGEVYNIRMPLCPICRAAQGQGPRG